MLEILLNSKVRVKVLKFFFEHDNVERYSQEVIDATKGDPANIHRELQKLVKLDVLAVRKDGHRKFYKVNEGSPYFRGLRELIMAGNEKSPVRQFKYLNEDTPWILGEDAPDMDLFFCQIWLSGCVNDFDKYHGTMFKKTLSVHEGYHLSYYYGDEDSSQVGQKLVGLLLKNSAFGQKVNEEIIKCSDRLSRFAATIPENNLDRLSNQELWKIWTEHDQIHTVYYQWGWVPVAADMFHSNLTNALMDELWRRKISTEKINEYFAILTSPKSQSLIQKEEEEFLTVAKAIQSDSKNRKLFKDLYRVFTEQEASGAGGLVPHTPQYEQLLEDRARTLRTKITPQLLRLIEHHFEKYFYLKHMWIGKDGVHSFNYYLKELVKLIGRDSNIDGMLRERQRDFQNSLEKRRVLMRQLKFTPHWKTIFDVFGDFMVTKIYRRFAQLYAVYRMQPVLEETARRLNISKMMMRFMMLSEVGEALLKGKIDRDELKERTKFCVYYVERGREAVFTGSEAKRLAARVKPKEVSGVEEIKGQVGCAGKAQGIVRLIFRPGDMHKMNEGDVLVSIATDPDIVPAMKKAAAIVTEQGGVTSHAAIVSRELNIPCVIGTKIATKVLKDGDLVDVDAVKGIVKVLKRA